MTFIWLVRRNGYVPVSGLALTLEYWRHILNYTSQAGAATLTKPDSKQDRLRRLGVLNLHPERVRAPWFQSNDFFDARDLIQVKYEMLRHVSVDGASKADAAELFGVSRPTFYQAEAAFARDGLAGLMPKPRGPKGAHKLNLEAMAFVERHLEGDGSIHARALAEQLESELGISVHPRSIERAIARKKKP
ncbi:transposase [Paraburkholderia graminis]|uniref:Transposase n=2 Tax=Burkholderiaceae TaxID=119060 RepID=A0ABD5CSH0_9BURK|nr:transposase [Paraburkholderia graminis]